MRRGLPVSVVKQMQQILYIFILRGVSLVVQTTFRDGPFLSTLSPDSNILPEISNFSLSRIRASSRQDVNRVSGTICKPFVE